MRDLARFAYLLFHTRSREQEFEFGYAISILYDTNKQFNRTTFGFELSDRSKMHERIEHAYIIMSFDQFREPVDLIIQNCC